MTEKGEKLKIIIYRPRPAFRTIWANWLFKCEPLEIEYLFTVLSNDADIVLIDGQVEKTSPTKMIRKHKADVFMITSLITNINEVHSLAVKVKGLRNPPLVFIGGPHAEVLPEHYYSPFVDGVFYNNQLEAVKTVVKAIREGKSYKDTPGAAFPVDGNFRKNGFQKVDYVNFPVPSRPMLAKHKGKYNLIYFDNCALLKTSFGCPGKCTFCFCREMNKGIYESRPIDSVIEEIKTIPNTNIFIVDDNFLINSNRLIDFCNKIEANNIKKKFIVYATAHFIAGHPDLIKKLKKAGLEAVLVGFEFITDNELSTYHKGSVQDENEVAIGICKELEIELMALFMIDPEWHPKEIRKLARFVAVKKIYLATFASVTTLPGTELWGNNEIPIDGKVKWWRYDLLRIHQKPRYMSTFRYYLWLIYLYLKLAYRRGAFSYFYRKAGLLKTIKIIFNFHISTMDFLIKTRLWP